MTDRDKIALIELVTCLLLALGAGISFGAWQDSAAAGVFMFVFSYTMTLG